MIRWKLITVQLRQTSRAFPVPPILNPLMKGNLDDFSPDIDRLEDLLFPLSFFLFIFIQSHQPPLYTPYTVRTSSHYTSSLVLFSFSFFSSSPLLTNVI